MGLDDFTGEGLSDAEKKRRQELSKNTPPKDASRWRHYEPGTPDWASITSGYEVTEDVNNLPDLEHGNEFMRSDSALVIQVDGLVSTELRSTKYVDLKNEN